MNRIKHLFLIAGFCSFYISFAQPINDNCGSATQLCPNQPVAATNIAATTQCGSADGDCLQGGTWGQCYDVHNSVWFKFTTNNIGGGVTVTISGIAPGGAQLQGVLLAVAIPCDATTYTGLNCNAGAFGGFVLNSGALLPNTTYWVQIDGATAGDQANFNIVVAGPAVDVTATLVLVDDLCGNSTGSITVNNVTGGQAPLTYSINGQPFQSSNVFNGLPAGNYTVTIKDANGCNYQQSLVVIAGSNGPISITFTTVDATCNNNNGSITVTSVNGGVPGYTYSLNGSPPQGSNTFNGLGGGTYLVTVIDANGCTYSVYVNVAITGGIQSAEPVVVNADCGVNNGSINIINIVGGVAPLTYSLNGGAAQGLPTFNGLAPGTYTVTIVDANNCPFTVYNIVVGTNPGPTAFVGNTVNAVCGNSAGSITVINEVGGVAPYTYSINGGGYVGGNVFAGLPAGTYTITIKDANGCTYAQQITVPETKGVTNAGTTIANPNCSATDGSITVSSITGGAPPYTYSLNGGGAQGSNQFSSLAQGSYTIIITDANGCQYTITNIVLTENNQITDINISVTDVLCGVSFGAVLVNGVTGGIAPYSYSVNGGPGLPGPNFTGLKTGPTTITVTDANGCTYTKTIDIPNNGISGCDAGPDVTITRGESTTLNGTTNGNPAAWTPPTALSDAASSTTIATPAATITYTLTTTTAEGCTCTDEVTVTVTPLIKIPNTFTPNGDGINDVWEIVYIEFYDDCEISVYNRWGERVFKQKGYEDGNEWNGTNNGLALPAATYYYVIRLNVPKDSDVQDLYEGSITIAK